MNCKTGCSAVRLAHLLWEQGVVGSNPATPTVLKKRSCDKMQFLFLLLDLGGFLHTLLYFCILKQNDVLVGIHGSKYS